MAWSEIHENQLATASGDGSIKMWDVTLNVSIDESEKEEGKGDFSYEIAKGRCEELLLPNDSKRIEEQENRKREKETSPIVIATSSIDFHLG